MRNNKITYVAALLFICIFTAGCNSLLQLKKPFVFYYTDYLSKDLKQSDSFICTILDTNFYKEQTIAQSEKDIIKKFIENLHKDNFIEKPKDLPAKPPYKIYLTINKNKYVMDVYNENYVSIYPWDGNYPMDFIKTSNVPASYNLYLLCKYIFTKQ